MALKLKQMKSLKPNILMLHGVSQQGHSWDFVALALSDRFHIMALDRLPSYVYSVIYGAAWALVFPWAAVNYQPFIYFQF